MVPQGCIQDSRVARIHAEICCTRIGADFQNMFPAFAAIRGAKNAAFFIRSPDLALNCNECDVGIGGVDFNLRNLTAFFQADVLPGLACIGGFPDAVATAGGHAADRCFAGADIKDVVVRFGNRHRADGANFEIVVGKVFPGGTRVLCLPYTTAGRAHVIQQRIVRHAGHRRHPPATIRADQAPLEALEQGRIHRLAGAGERRPGQQGQHNQQGSI